MNEPKEPDIVEVDFLDIQAEVAAVQKSYMDQAVKEFVRLYPNEPQTGSLFNGFVTTYSIGQMAYDLIELRDQLKDLKGGVL
jgi:hypothetical protein